MDLIIETDIGRDPDDFFAILYLFATGVNIRAILVSPGDPDQIALVKFILKELEMDIPVGTDILNRNKKSLTGLHNFLIEKYKFQTQMSSDGYSPEIAEEIFRVFPDSELFVIGPPIGIGNFLKKIHEIEIKRATIQGGFIGYDVHKLPCRRLKKFEAKETVQTFNLSGSLQGTNSILNCKITKRQFVSKNVNHTVVFGNKQYELLSEIKPKNRAMELFHEGAKILNRTRGKKFHDPVAAVCHLHPEIATWVNARLFNKINNEKYLEWGAVLDESGGDDIIIDIDYERFWYYILNGE